MAGNSRHDVMGATDERHQAACRAYLDNACMGRPDSKVLHEVGSLLAKLSRATQSPTDLTVDLYRYYARARKAVAGLVGANEDDIALVESTSHGLGLMAAALPLRPGDNVLVCDLEFLPTVLCWQARTLNVDFEVRCVPTQGGQVRPEDFAALADKRTRAIAVSAVQEINGFRVDVPALADVAHSLGAVLIVDGVQEVGAMSVDVTRSGADVYCAGGHKWLRNPLGMGFLWLGPRVKDVLEPPAYAYFNLAEPNGGWGEYLTSPLRNPFDPLTVTQTAARFETGAYGNFAGALALALNAERLCVEGPREVERRVLERGDHLLAGLEQRGLPVVSRLEPEHRSGSITFHMPRGREQELALNRYLDAESIFVSVRYTSGIGGVRVSPHYFTDLDEIDNFFVELDWFLTKGSPMV